MTQQLDDYGRDRYGNRRWETTLRRLVDPESFDQDAVYHMMVKMFRNWLVVTEGAMEDEDVDRQTIQRVLNRIVYACPDGAMAHERIAMDKTMRDVVAKTTPRYDHTGHPLSNP